MTTQSPTATVPHRTPAGRLRAAFGPLLQLHARSYLSGVALQVVMVMVLVEAVFLAERFPIVFRAVFQHHADLYDTTLLFLCNTPQVFDLALAIGILLAVYWTTLRMRENRELLVLFAAGSGPYRLLAVVLLIAVAGGLTSVFVSGVVDPATRYAQRRILFDAEFRALRNGINTGQFYTFNNRVAYAPARASESSTDATRSLFIYEQLPNNRFRAITAERAILHGPDQAGIIRLKLDGFFSRTFSTVRKPAAAVQAHPGGTCPECAQPPLSRIKMSAMDVTQQMPADQLLTLLPRGSTGDEVTLLEELQTHPGTPSPREMEDMRLLGERLARGLLCLLAPLIALAAICFTFRGTNYFILPLACLALMALNVTSGWLIKLIAPATPLAALGVPAAFTVVLAVLLVVEIVLRQGWLAQPQLARP